MGVKLPNGAIFSIASGYSAEHTMASISNALEAVATLEDGHAVIAGQILVVGSGWTGLDGRVARAKSVLIDAVTLEKIDTTDADRFLAGSGGGKVRAVTDWTEIQQITDFATSGGDQNFASYSFLSDDEERQLPTTKSPTSIKIKTADDPELQHNAVLEKADLDRQPRVFRLKLPGGSAIYYNGYVSFNQTPSMGKNNIMEVTTSLSLISRLTRYAA
ncbi:phage tail protein [Herbaspirillum autotrophicum]|uniref:phage tail protein n=1 Tax=Herbaspirillum autotrophicum TaxID=180195 RepID=UPI0009F880A7|nr:phage tail protein [Herbaspirillum autotrophicum]